MARIVFEYDPAEPGDIGVELDISEEDKLDATKLAEILAAGVNSVIISSWDTNEDREQVGLLVAKLLLVAIDKRRGYDDE